MEQKEIKLAKIRENLKKLFFVSYGIILLLIVIYSYSVLKVNKVDVLTKSNVENKDEPRVSKVYVELNQNSKLTNFDLSMTSDDTVLDIFKNLRKSKKLDYEITEYTTGVVFDEVNMVKSTPNNPWKVLLNGTDITKTIRNLKVVENGKYVLTNAK